MTPFTDKQMDAAARAIYGEARRQAGFPTDFDGAPTPVAHTYRQMGRAALAVLNAAEEAEEEVFTLPATPATTWDVIVHEAQALRAALERGDREDAARTIATLQQELHLAKLTFDPDERQAGAITSTNGKPIYPAHPTARNAANASDTSLPSNTIQDWEAHR